MTTSDNPYVVSAPRLSLSAQFSLLSLAPLLVDRGTLDSQIFDHSYLRNSECFVSSRAWGHICPAIRETAPAHVRPPQRGRISAARNRTTCLARASSRQSSPILELAPISIVAPFSHMKQTLRPNLRMICDNDGTFPEGSGVDGNPDAASRNNTASLPNPSKCLAIRRRTSTASSGNARPIP